MTVSDDDINVFMDEELMARRVKAMFLKNAGATLAKIAEECQVSVATVRKDLAIVRRDINNEPPLDVIARHRAVIFDIQRANYPAMMRGDKDAAVTILRALTREARLLGLDQPVKLLASVSNEEFANEAARLIARINALDANTLKELERARGHDPNIIEGDVIPDATPATTSTDGHTGDEQLAVGAAPHRGPAEALVPRAAPSPPSEVLGPYRPGQPYRDPCAIPDATGGATGLPGRPGQGRLPAGGEAGDTTDPDNDDDWSNI